MLCYLKYKAEENTQSLAGDVKVLSSGSTTKTGSSYQHTTGNHTGPQASQSS
jgi:hypothetical protein